VTDSSRFEIPDANAMRALGIEFAPSLMSGDVVLLHGDLGAGKTTLTQGIAQGLQVAGPIQSPTFSIVAEHAAITASGESVTLYHLDLYRLEDPAELEGLGYDQFIAPRSGIAVIEWPERARDWLPDRFWLIHITHAASGGRHVDRRVVDRT
jgi:tRNA threonylcarbamoyladenosine biosynthesis protein TsaE